MKTFVVGFVFNNKEEVLLIRKLKPSWQAGFLNGVGGKCETDEDIYTAMVREFHEEVGVIIPNGHWRLFCKTTARDGQVAFFTAKYDGVIYQMEAEEPIWMPYIHLNRHVVIDNLRWLIPMALAEKRVQATVIELN